MLRFCTRGLLVATMVLLSASSVTSDDGCRSCRVDLAQFEGCWHEVARSPNLFQRNCRQSTAEYRMLPDGRVQVTNRCATCRGGCRSLVGSACSTNPPCNTKLIVSFDVPFGRLSQRLGRPNYEIHYVSADYRTAVVGTPQRGLYWVLAREPNLDEASIQHLLAIAAAHGYDTSCPIR